VRENRMHGSTGGDWHGATYATGQSSTLPLIMAWSSSGSLRLVYR
jgi:hypothetical protein